MAVKGLDVQALSRVGDEPLVSERLKWLRIITITITSIREQETDAWFWRSPSTWD